VAATLDHGGTEPATVTVATYTENPTTATTFEPARIFLLQPLQDRGHCLARNALVGAQIEELGQMG